MAIKNELELAISKRIISFIPIYHLHAFVNIVHNYSPISLKALESNFKKYTLGIEYKSTEWNIQPLIESLTVMFKFIFTTVQVRICFKIQWNNHLANSNTIVYPSGQARQKKKDSFAWMLPFITFDKASFLLYYFFIFLFALVHFMHIFFPFCGFSFL